MLGGFLLVWMGLRSVSGPETEAEHLYGGRMESITCEGDTPVAGKGIHVQSARQKCQAAQADQRGRGPWWIVAGLGVAGYGVVQLRNARA